LAGIGFAFTTLVVNESFQKRPWQLVLINGGYYVVALIVVVNVALIGAVLRFRARRGAEARPLAAARSAQAWVTGGLAALAAALFTVSVVFTEKARDVAPTGPDGLQRASALTEDSGAAPIGGSTPPPGRSADPLEITATGQQWLWRYTYPNGAFSYYRLVVPVDTAVKLRLVSTDVVHGWYVPALARKADAVPGKTNFTTFRAEETGTYEGRSSTFSGAAYASDRIAVEVVSPPEYESFIKDQKRGIQESQDIVARQLEGGETP
jgi:heme/copper-type cytochrome/quinol oxidase subunit 2